MNNLSEFKCCFFVAFQNGYVVTPYIPPPKLMVLCIIFLEVFLDAVPLNVGQNMRFQLGGVRHHVSLDLREHVDRQSGQRLVGYGGPIA